LCGRLLTYVTFLRRVEGWEAGFYVYRFLTALTYGMYLVASRDLVKVTLGNAYGFIGALVAAENIPAIVSVFVGGAADILGRRRVVLVGLLGVPALVLMSFTPIQALPVLAGAYVTFWTAAITAVTGAFLDRTKSSSKRYSIYAMFGSAGWGVGGVIAGAISQARGDRAVFLVAAAAFTAALLAAYFKHPGGGGGVRFGEVLSGARKVLLPLLAIALTIAAADMFYGVFSLKLRSIAGSAELFGVLYAALPSVTGVLIRPLAGYAIEFFGPLKSFAAVIASYVTILPAMAVLTGLPAIMLWAVPVWPFLDQSSTIMISRSLPRRLQSLAAGVITTAYSVGGAAVLVTSLTPALRSLWSAALTSLAMLACSAAFITAHALRSRHKRLHRPVVEG